MKRLLTTALALATLVGGSSAAFAASAQDRHDQREIRRDHQEVRQDRRELHRDQRQAGRHWNRGQRLDNRYGAYQPVNDWRSRRLAAPRRGYHWVRSGDDYVQAALVGGLIASVVAASR